MIDRKELRIGNWVNSEKDNYLDNKGFQKVEIIGYRGINEWQDMGAGGEVPFENLNGIPISPYILIGCGFVVRGGIWQYPSDADLHFYFRDNIFFPNDYYTAQPMTPSAYPKYFHQLQNLIFALTGKELEINL